MIQQTGLLCHTADMSAVGHSRHCLLCDAVDMPLLLATQKHSFASQKGRGSPPYAHDAIVRHATYKIYITQNLGFVSQVGRGKPLPSCDTKPQFCVATKALDPS